MSDREEWGEWRLHDGGPCPVKGCFVHIVFDEGWPREKFTVAMGDPVAWEWAVPRMPGVQWGKVIKFRVRKPRALQQIREMIETLPAPSRQKEDA